MDRLARQIRDWLAPLTLHAVRMTLTCRQTVPFSISTLRGVWGRALHQIHQNTYDAVFEGSGPPNQRQPLYIIRPDLRFKDDERNIGVEWITWNTTEEQFGILEEAWDLAGDMGLGDRRIPFYISEISPLFSKEDRPVSLSEVVEKIKNASEPCRLSFPHSLRLMRHGKLLKTPTFSDLIEAAFFRLSPFLCDVTKTSGNPRDCWPLFAEALLALATTIPSTPWHGEEVMFERYSGRQKTEVRQASVLGSLSLPTGAGSLWPLLAAASVLHLGKGTVMGLGRLVVESL